MSKANLATSLWRWPVVLVAAATLTACGEAPTNVAAIGDARLGVIGDIGGNPRPGDNKVFPEALEVCKTWAPGVTPQDITVRLQVTGGATYDGTFVIRPNEGIDAQGNPVQCRVLWSNDRRNPVDQATVTELTPSSGYTTNWIVETSLSPTSGSVVAGPTFNGSGAIAMTVPIGGALDNPGALVRFVNTPIPLGSIGDRVWNDVDGDGVQDAGEAGIGGVAVTITENGNPVGSSTTDANGLYSFGSLPAGTYVVCVAQPAGTTQTYDLDGLGTPNCATATLGVGENRTDVDFGYQERSGQIGDFVWLDANGNGVQDPGELGIGGVSVTLSGTVSASTTTSSTGAYLFNGLPAGSYTVTVATPAGLTASPSNQGGDPTKDSNGSPASVSLLTGSSSDLTIDFGFVPPAGGGQGCTPGYWKQSQHFDSWKGYTQTDMVDAVFGVTYRSTHKQNPSGPLSLLQALGLNGNNNGEQLFRHGTAALLNAVYQSGVSSPYTAGQVIAMVRNAWISGNKANIESATTLLGRANELGCPLN